MSLPNMHIQDPKKYDLCVIGCGSGGFAAAMRAFDLGKNVCIVEKGEIGGAGVMWGALASKTMWELAKDYSIAAKVDRGYRASGLMVDYPTMRSTVIQAVKEKQYQMLSQIETFSPQHRKGPGSLTLKRGRAFFISPHKVKIAYPDNHQEDIAAQYFLVATGSKPNNLPGIEVDQNQIVNSDSILNLTAFPKRLMIIGAGIVGCEYATIFSNFGQTKVYLVDRAERIIPFEDEDISEFVASSLLQKGVKIFHSAILRNIVKHPKHLEVILDFSDGHTEVVEVDTALISIGRSPEIASLGLEKAGIQPDDRNYLVTDENCRVKDHIYAVGDVTHFPNLVNMAEVEGRLAVKHMYGVKKWPLNYSNMSTIMFFYPPVAAVGLNEQQCRKKKIPYRVAYYANSILSRAIAMRALQGFIKIIVSDTEDQMILGMRAAGPQSSSTIMSIAYLIDQAKGIKDVLKSVHPHPSMSEGIQECLRLLLDKSIYKVQAFPQHLKIRTWQPEKSNED